MPPFYDSMMGKLIVYAQTREEAIRKMNAALMRTGGGGGATTTCELAAGDHQRSESFWPDDYYTDFYGEKR